MRKELPAEILRMRLCYFWFRMPQTRIAKFSKIVWLHVYICKWCSKFFQWILRSGKSDHRCAVDTDRLQYASSMSVNLHGGHDLSESMFHYHSLRLIKLISEPASGWPPACSLLEPSHSPSFDALRQHKHQVHTRQCMSIAFDGLGHPGWVGRGVCRP